MTILIHDDIKNTGQMLTYPIIDDPHAECIKDIQHWQMECERLKKALRKIIEFKGSRMLNMKTKKIIDIAEKVLYE